jgi:hypothetical protein
MLREGSIIEYTEQVAGEIASRYAGDPLTELELWLRLAHQREAMVTQLYELAGFEARLHEMPQGGIGGLVTSVVRGIWAHERSHTEFLASIRASNAAWGALAELQGLIEGWVVNRALRGLAGGRLLIAVGSSVGKTPEFARDLHQMSLEQLIAFSAELETTARMGYQRILQIAASMPDQQATAHDYGFTFQYDIARIEREESFHEGVFQEMQRWIGQTTDNGPARTLESCTRNLHALCGETLSVDAVRRAAAGQRRDFEWQTPAGAGAGSWASDGGLGAVFAAAGLDVPVVGRPS